MPDHFDKDVERAKATIAAVTDSIANLLSILPHANRVQAARIKIMIAFNQQLAESNRNALYTIAVLRD